ncbi:hypothetical protein GALL_214470 [mine drainage metagenome]|uniref:Uncharacterized protein n=1 Tax=mine drainage metagenome TaxID=410659 RepID=A0A1J5RKF2_9ZZZZ
MSNLFRRRLTCASKLNPVRGGRSQNHPIHAGAARMSNLFRRRLTCASKLNPVRGGRSQNHPIHAGAARMSNLFRRRLTCASKLNPVRGSRSQNHPIHAGAERMRHLSPPSLRAKRGNPRLLRRSAPRNDGSESSLRAQRSNLRADCRGLRPRSDERRKSLWDEGSGHTVRTDFAGDIER